MANVLEYLYLLTIQPPDKYAFFYEDRIIEFKPPTPYILNTRKVHGAMSFSDGTYHLLMSVNNTEANPDDCT